MSKSITGPLPGKLSEEMVVIVTNRYKQEQYIKTGVVNNAIGLYWLNISPLSGPPTEGNRMTRKGLIELRDQITNVLEGHGGGGWSFIVRVDRIA